MTDSMTGTVTALGQAEELIASVLEGVRFGLLADEDAVDLMGSLERVGRRLDAARVCSAADMGDRAEFDLGHGSLAWRMGCRGKLDLVAALTRVSGQEAKRRMRLGAVASERMQLGAPLPPLYPAVAEALGSGALGVESAEVIVTALGHVAQRTTPDALHRAERALVASATGALTPETEGLPGAGIAFSADLLRGQALEWQARLDPEGVAPVDEVAEAKSNIGFGLLRGGLYPLRGGVTPELRGIMNMIFDTNLSANSTPAHATPAFPSGEEQARFAAGEVIPGAENCPGELFTGDTRTGGEKRADILRGVFETATRDPKTPSMGGAAPTVMVHVNAADLAKDCGVGWTDGVEAPVSLRTVKQMICTGGYQKIIFGENGEVLHLGEKKRFFTSGQRRAIAARDGGCIIPGCPIAAYWCEVHHVIPWQHHGATDVDNGVLLCWYHHHSIDTSGWQIRMVRGKPEVRGPAWVDPTRTWRPARNHRAATATETPPWHISTNRNG